MSNWPAVPFGKVAEVVTGNTPPKKDPENYGAGIPWVKPPDLDSHLPITGTKETLSKIGQAKARVLPADTVLVCCIGSIGKVGIAGTVLATNQQINSLVFGDLVEPRFGYYYCRSIKPVFQYNAGKAVVPILKKTDFAKIEMPVPPLAEQRRIVEILDQADNLRRKRTEADRIAARILPALFIKMFGDPAANPRGWKKDKLVDRVDSIIYGLAEQLSNSETRETGTPIVRISNVQKEGELELTDMRYWRADDDLLDRLRLESGDLLFNWRNGSSGHLGKTAIWEKSLENAIFVSFLLRIRCGNNGLRPYFLWALINKLRADGFFSRTSRMQINHKFNATELGDLEVIIPPSDLQESFEKKVLFLKSLREKRNRRRAEIEKLFAVLLQRAFSGEMTAGWRAAHIKELFEEMEIRRRELDLNAVKTAKLF